MFYNRQMLISVIKSIIIIIIIIIYLQRFISRFVFDARPVHVRSVLDEVALG